MHPQQVVYVDHNELSTFAHSAKGGQHSAQVPFPKAGPAGYWSRSMKSLTCTCGLFETNYASARQQGTASMYTHPRINSAKFLGQL